MIAETTEITQISVIPARQSEVGTYALPEGQDAAYARGFGDLSVQDRDFGLYIFQYTGP